MTDQLKIYEKVNGLGQTNFKVVQEFKDSYAGWVLGEFDTLARAQKFREAVRTEKRLEVLKQFKTVKVYD